MSNQLSGDQEPQAKDPDSGAWSPESLEQSTENLSSKVQSTLDVGDQSMATSPDQDMTGEGPLQNETSIFLTAANFSEDDNGQITSSTDTVERLKSTHLDTADPAPPEEEGRPAIIVDPHVTMDTTNMTSGDEDTEASRNLGGPLDDEVQIVQGDSGMTESSSDVHFVGQSGQNTIDLTMGDDDEDEYYEYSLNSLPKQTAEKQVKLEPVDDDISQAVLEDTGASLDTTNTFHGLPEFEPTALPGDVEATVSDGGLDQNGGLTQEQMALMLQQFNANNAGAAAVVDDSNIDDSSEEEDLRRRGSFARLKERHEELQRQGTGSTIGDINFTRAAKEEELRLLARKNRKQQEYDDIAQNEQSLFIPEESVLSLQVDDDLPDDIPYAYASASVTRSPVPLDSEPASSGKKPVRGRPKGSKNKSAQQKAAAENSRVSKQPSSRAGAKRGKKQNQRVTINTDALLHHDIIAEATANQGQAPQPGFTSTVKKDALTQLISSIPIEERNLYAGDKANLIKATKNFNGRGAIKSDGNGNWKLKGMKSSLRNYQLMGVSWMRSRENQKNNPRGGILGDDMGLGKTVSALANMVDGRPASNHTGPTATLIVVPPSLMNQWMSEIAKHVECLRNVMIYRSKMKFMDPVAQLSTQDVVITSYHEIVRSFPNNNPPPQLYTAQAKAEWWAKQIAENKGPLHQVYWHRIVLDEAQAIKNYLSKTSQAVCHLRGCFRWCLSGTPVQNGLEEFYPYFRFLKYPHTGSFELFKRNFVKRNSDKAILRLQAVLGEIMLRRTHVDKLFGRPILILPPIKPMETIEVKFNSVERAVYNIVKHRFVTRVQALSKKDNPNNNYQQIFVLLLRLRQLIAHPLLIQRTLKELLETEDLERLWSLTKDNAALASGTDVASDGNKETAHAIEYALMEADKPGSSLPFPGSKRTQVVDNQLSANFRKYLDALRKDGNWAKANERSLCSACGSPPSQPFITSCLHLYCLSCLNDLHLSEFLKQKEEANCLQCNARIRKNEAYAAKAYDDAGGNNATDTRQTPEEDIDWYSVSGPILRSAKVKGTVTQIKKWFDQDATNKIIVFTQFRGMIRVMERVCREEQWGFASYHGAMSFDYRDEQLRDFANKPEKRILLAAMKAGGVGLNLTAANRVIILDLWWNSSVEMQAFTRCFRIGQKRDVEVARFVVPDSIDMDILRMQERKKAEIESAMEERHRLRLTIQDLIELFGGSPDNEDKDGTQQDGTLDNGDEDGFVFPDDPYDKEDEDDDVVMIE